MPTLNKIDIPDRLYFKIGDVAELLGVKPYVLRYWESEFSMISPQKSPSGQRVYRKSDIEAALLVKFLLYEERYSIEGAKKRIKELRREGELKALKEVALAAQVHTPENPTLEVREIPLAGSSQVAAEAVVATAVPVHGDAFSTELRDEVRTLMLDIVQLSQRSIEDLFRC